MIAQDTRLTIKPSVTTYETREGSTYSIIFNLWEHSSSQDLTEKIYSWMLLGTSKREINLYYSRVRNHEDEVTPNQAYPPTPITIDYNHDEVKSLSITHRTTPHNENTVAWLRDNL